MRISIVLSLAFLASVAASKPMPKNSYSNPFTGHPDKPTTAQPDKPTTAQPEPPPETPAPPPVTTFLTIITSIYTFSAIISETPVTTVTQILIVTPVTTVENIVTIATMTTYVPIVTVGPFTTAAVITKASTITVTSPMTTFAPMITNAPVTIISTFTTVLSPTTKVSKRTLPPIEAYGVDPGRSNTTTKCSAPGSSGDDADISSGFLPTENVLPQVPDKETYELDRRSAQIGRAQLMDDVNLIQLKVHEVNTALQNVSCLGLEENLAIIAQQLNEAEVVVVDAQNLLLLPGDLNVPATSSSILPTCQPTHRPTAIQWGATLYYCDRQ